MDEVAKTLLQQIRALNPHFMTEFRVDKILYGGKDWHLRLHCRSSNYTVNIDIFYDRSWDLYNFKAYKLVEETEKFQGQVVDVHMRLFLVYEVEQIYTENLIDVIRNCLEAARKGKIIRELSVDGRELGMSTLSMLVREPVPQWFNIRTAKFKDSLYAEKRKLEKQGIRARIFQAKDDYWVLSIDLRDRHLLQSV